MADLCVNCQMCAVECPAAVDIPRLMMEGKGALHGGQRPATLRLGHVPARPAGGLACRVSPLANWALANRLMRWLMEKTFGIAQGRKLPRFASRTFLRRAARRHLTRPHGPQRPQSGLLRRHVRQLPRPAVGRSTRRGDGAQRDRRSTCRRNRSRRAWRRSPAVPWTSPGELAQQNVAVLAEAVRQGYHIVATEPAGRAGLIREYPSLLDDDDARLVADNTSEACAYLWKLHTPGKLQLDLQPINATIGYHMPCQLKALRRGLARREPAAADPRLDRAPVEEGCSGMAGTFGLATGELPRQLAGRPGPDRPAPRSEHPGRRHRVQHLQDANGTGHHQADDPPLKLLVLAYGLMPELASLLTTSGKELVVT